MGGPHALKLQQVEPEQARELESLCRAVYQQHYEHLWLEGGSAWYQDEMYGRELLESELLDEEIRYYFLDWDSERAGFAKLHLGGPTNAGEAELSKLYLLSEFTGRGVGKVALEGACATGQGCRLQSRVAKCNGLEHRRDSVLLRLWIY
jgi:GNAT superfamily N-acetyltransferase